MPDEAPVIQNTLDLYASRGGFEMMADPKSPWRFRAMRSFAVDITASSDDAKPIDAKASLII